MTRTDEVRSIAEPLVAARGFELYDIEEHGPIVRVTVTGPLGGDRPGIADLSSISRELSRALDESDPISGRYTLEVSSPGLERRLRTLDHFQRAIGETVTVKVRERGEPTTRVRGIIRSVDTDGITLDAQNESGDPTGDVTQISHDTIDTARTIFEWGMTPPEQPGTTESTGSTRRTES